jgi:Mitochondrial carrier protein
LSSLAFNSSNAFLRAPAQTGSFAWTLWFDCFDVQGGISGAVAKTATAPIERVKLLIQTQVMRLIDVLSLAKLQLVAAKHWQIEKPSAHVHVYCFMLQDANPRIRSGEIPRYTSISNCFKRVYNEQGTLAFWYVLNHVLSNKQCLLF